MLLWIAVAVFATTLALSLIDHARNANAVSVVSAWCSSIGTAGTLWLALR